MYYPISKEVDSTVQYVSADGLNLGPNNCKDTKQMSSLLVFNRVYRLEIQSVMLVYSTPLVNQRPSNLLTGVIHCVFYQILNLQNCFITTPDKNLGGEGAAMSLYRSIFKKSRHLWLESISYFVHAQHKLSRPKILYHQTLFSSRPVRGLTNIRSDSILWMFGCNKGLSYDEKGDLLLNIEYKSWDCIQREWDIAYYCGWDE